MKTSLLTCISLLLAIVSPLRSAEPETFHWETGPGWFGERIQLPPSFAPEMDWKGMEEIRFAPGMFKSDRPDFFSYALVFSLTSDADLSPDALRKQILLYYKGLSSRVSAGKGRKVDVSKFSVELLPANDLSETTPKQAVKASAYLASLQWIEPFATGKPQKLHLEIHAWKDKERKRSYVFFCASPQAPDAPIRKTLQNIRATFRVK